MKHLDIILTQCIKHLFEENYKTQRCQGKRVNGEIIHVYG